MQGIVSIDIDLAGPVQKLVGRAELRASEILLNGTALPSFAIEAVSDTDAVRLTGRRGDGTLMLSGILPLSEPYVLRCEVPLSALPWSEVVESLEPSGMETAEWSAEGTLAFEVPLREPETLRYRASFSSLLGDYERVRVETSPFVVEGGLASLQVQELELRGTHNRAWIDGSIPLDPDEFYDLAIEGDVGLGFLELLYEELEIGGRGRAQLRVRGPASAPDVTGSLQLEDGFGRFDQVTWSDLDFSLRSNETTLPSLSVTASLLGGRLQVTGQAPLGARAGVASIDWQLQGMELGPLLPDAFQSLSLVTSAGGTINAPALDWASLEGSGRIDELRAQGPDSMVELSRPTPWTLSAGTLRIPELGLEGDGSKLAMSLDSLRFDEEISFSSSGKGHLDLAILNPALAKQGLRVGGAADVAAHVEYDGVTLSLEGEGDLRDGRFRLASPAFSITEARARLELSGSTIALTKVEARAGSGSLRGEGTLDWSDPTRPRLNLTATAADVPLEVMEGLRAQVSGDIRLANPDDALELSGTLVVDRGLFTREFEDEASGFDAQTLSMRDPTTAGGLADRLALSLVIGTERNIRIENSTAELEVQGSVSIGGTPASPELGGVVTLVPDGAFNVGHNRFQVVQGRIDLTGAPVVPPRITVLAVTRVGSTVINIDVDGDVEDLGTRLTSPDNPELTEGDLASLLVTGRTLENASEGGQQMASTWMMSSMANLMHDGLGDLISFGPPPGAGPLILSEEADPTSRLSLGVPITERFSITYSMALDDTERRMWILDYRLAHNIWLRGIQENANDYSVGLSQRFDIDVRGSAQRATASRGASQGVATFDIVGGDPMLVRSSKIRSGDRYDYWKARDEAERVQTSLVQDGYLGAVVDVETKVRESEVDVTLLVETGKRIELSWEGDDPGKEIRKIVRRAWDGRIPEEFLLVEITERALARLRANRYYGARLTHRIEDEGELRRVVFELERGARGERVDLFFEGNEALDQESLRAVLPSPKTPEFFSLLERSSELERGFRLRYATDGYLDTTISPPTTNFDEGILRVEIAVDEGPITRMADIAFEGLSAFEAERLVEELGIEQGATVNFQQIRRGQTSIRTLYRNEGFPDVRLRAELDRSPSGLHVKLIVDEGTRARVGGVRVVGNVKTRDSVILNELTFHPGDPVRIIDFQETQKRLYDLGIFCSADVRPDLSQSGQEVQGVVIQVVERADLDVNYGLRYNVVTSDQSLDKELEPKSTGLEGTLRATFINAFKRGTNIGFAAFVQERHQLFRGTFRMPTFFRRRLITEFIFESEKEIDRLEIAGFDTRARAVTFQQTKKLRDDRYDRFALQWNVRISRFFGGAISEDGKVFDFDTNRPRFGISLIEDHRDSFANPTRGRFWNVTAQYTPEIWGADLTYVRLYGQLFYYYPLAESIVWASAFRLGVANGSRDLLLIEDRFQAGGANSVRGFEQNTLGPSVILESGEEIFVGGEAVAVLNQEIRFPIYKALAGGVFWDAGNVFARAEELSLSQLKHSAGAGIRFVLPFGAIRLDWARVLNPDDDESTSRWHFAFGYAF